MDWEHLKLGISRRRNVNQQVKRLVAAAAEHMAKHSSWSTISKSLQRVVFKDWWSVVLDEKIFSQKASAGFWLARDLAGLADTLLTVHTSGLTHGVTRASRRSCISAICMAMVRTPEIRQSSEYD